MYEDTCCAAITQNIGVASSINRAVALYRYFVGIPTDQDPPVPR
jgi:hypothetical protein